jgi:hypothetical protein
MSVGDTPELADRLAGHGREILLERLRSAFAREAASQGSVVDIDPVALEQLVQDAAARAGGALWLRSLAQAAMDELGIDLAAAVHHPAVAQARELTGAPVYLTAPAPEVVPETETETETETESAQPAQPAEPEPAAEALPEPEPGAELTPAAPEIPVPEPAPPLSEPQALRLAAVHVSGIETLRQGDRDLELRLSDAGLDVLKRSSGAAIVRLEWSEIESIQVAPPKRGLRARRRGRELHVTTGRGQAQFELPGLTDEELHEHLEPALERLHGGTAGVSGA